MMTLNNVAEVVRNKFLDRNVYFTDKELPTGFFVPDEWKDFGLSAESSSRFPSSWHLFVDELPWVLSLLDLGLIGTAILDGDNIELLYIFHDVNGLYYYIGGLPLNMCSSNVDNLFPFKGKVSEFYYKVHNGFTFFPAQSMGPQKAEHFTCVADLIDEEDTDFASQWMTLLSNGAGDYLAVDLADSEANQGIIYWHEEPLNPEVGVSVFEVMDTWMSIFLEDTKPRADVIRYG